MAKARPFSDCIPTLSDVGRKLKHRMFDNSDSLTRAEEEKENWEALSILLGQKITSRKQVEAILTRYEEMRTKGLIS